MLLQKNKQGLLSDSYFFIFVFFMYLIYITATFAD